MTSNDADERELQELALALRADSPDPDPGFAAALHERVAAGFEPEPGPAGSLRAAERVRGTLRSAAGRLSGLTPRLTPRYVGGVAAVFCAVAIGGGVLSQTLQPSGGLTTIEAQAPDSTVDSRSGMEPAPADPMLDVAPAPDNGRSGESRDEHIPSKAIGASGGGGGSDAGSFATPGQEFKRTDSPSGDMAVEESVVAPEPPFPGGPKQNESLRQRDRIVERTAYMTIAAPIDELAEVARGVAATARRHGGFVLNSTMTTGEKANGGGNFELRVPVDQLDATLADLGDLGEVRSQTVDEQDVTSSFESLEDMLKAARAERKSLLTRLENADTDLEAESIRRQLKAANRETGRLENDQQQLEKRVSYAAVSVTLEKGKGDTGNTVGQALDDAAEILLASLGILVRILAVLIPLGIVGGIVWLVVRGIRRRRRESALD